MISATQSCHKNVNFMAGTGVRTNRDWLLIESSFETKTPGVGTTGRGESKRTVSAKRPFYRITMALRQKPRRESRRSLH